MCACSVTPVASDSPNPWTVARQALYLWNSPGKNTGYLPKQVVEPVSLTSTALASSLLSSTAIWKVPESIISPYLYTYIDGDIHYFWKNFDSYVIKDS